MLFVFKAKQGIRIGIESETYHGHFLYDHEGQTTSPLFNTIIGEQILNKLELSPGAPLPRKITKETNYAIAIYPPTRVFCGNLCYTKRPILQS